MSVRPIVPRMSKLTNGMVKANAPRGIISFFKRPTKVMRTVPPIRPSKRKISLKKMSWDQE